MNTSDPTPEHHIVFIDAAPRGGDPRTGWVRFDADTYGLLLDALRVAADWLEDDLDCGACLDRICTDSDHAEWMEQVRGWRALGRHLDPTGTAAAHPPAYPNEAPRLGPVILDVATSEPDGLGRMCTGQLFGPGHGVLHAINTARHLAGLPGTLSVTVTEHRRTDRRVLFQHGVTGEPDLDPTPSCPRCTGGHCRDVTAHYRAIGPLLALWADRQGGR